MSLSFAGCGFLCIYHAGVCAAIKVTFWFLLLYEVTELKQFLKCVLVGYFWDRAIYFKTWISVYESKKFTIIGEMRPKNHFTIFCQKSWFEF